MKERHLILSRMQTPDGTILTSRHRHDYVAHEDANGEYYFLDGGNDYQRWSLNKEPMKDLSVWSDAPFEEIRKAALRGTFDENGCRVWRPICELSNAHLANIVIYNMKYVLGSCSHC